MKRSVPLACTVVLLSHGFAQDLVLDPTFTSSSTNVAQGISVMVLQPDGRIVCGGGFDAYNGVPREDLVRLDPDGTVDMGFAPMPTTGPGASVQALFVRSDGKIVVGGAFAEMNGAPATGLARLMPNGTNDGGFLHGLDAYLFAVATTPNGDLFVGGDIFSPPAGILMLSPTGSTMAWPPLVPSTQCLRVQPDGKVLVGLSDAPYLARLEQNATVDATFTPAISAPFGFIGDIVVHADGRITIVGDFTTVDGQPRARIARLMPDGSLDASFDPGLGLDGAAIAVDTMSDGDILVAGYFANYNGATANGNLLRINADGSLDTSFVCTGIRDILVQPDGKVLLSGALMTFDGVFRNGVMRLMPDPSTGTATASPRPVQVWPSPAQDVLNIRGLEVGAGVMICDAMGRIVRYDRHTGTPLSMGELPGGTYLLCWTLVGSRGQVRFIKQ